MYNAVRQNWCQINRNIMTTYVKCVGRTQVEQVTPNCNQIAYNHALHFIHIDPEAYSYTSDFARPGHPPVRVRARTPDFDPRSHPRALSVRHYGVE
jgi:hypothetical protein